MKFRKVVSTVFVFLLGLSLFAQVGVNPEEEFYTDALAWSLKGYVKNLPLLKPYPQNIIKDILEQVSECPDEHDAKRAEMYLHKMYDRIFHVSLESDLDTKFKQVEKAQDTKKAKWENKLFIDSEILTVGDYAFTPKLGASWEIGVTGYNNDVTLADVHPKYIFDSKQQKIDVLSFPIGIVDLLLDTNANVTYGDKDLYFTFGFNKTGFGIFPKTDLILNPSAYQAFNTSATYNHRLFSYTHYMGLLGSRSTINENSYFFKKIMAFQAIKFPLFKNKFSITYYEASVGSTPFMAAYVMPVPFVILGNVSSFNDNILAGLDFEFRPLSCIALIADIMFDDLKPLNFIKFNWNEAAIRAAARVGFVYSPYNSICNLISCDYTLVTPFTYSSYDPENLEYNGNDYTNCGICVGSDLPPNSDRILVRIEFKPYRNLKLSTFTSFVRHSNEYLSLFSINPPSVLTDEINIPENAPSDGGITTSTLGISNFTDYTNFMNQFTTMYTIQAGLSAEYLFANTKTGSYSVALGYKFEYIRQDGVDNPIFTGTVTNTSEALDCFINWYSGLHDSVNNYLSLSFKYTY